MTDKQRLLEYFKSKPNTEVNAYTEIVGVEGLRILEYSGRISDLREDLGCTCGKDPAECTASEHILNTRKGYYKFVTFMQPVWQSVDPQTLEEKLEALRIAYKNAPDSEKPLIKVRGLALKRSQDKAIKDQVKSALF